MVETRKTPSRKRNGARLTVSRVQLYDLVGIDDRLRSALAHYERCLVDSDGVTWRACLSLEHEALAHPEFGDLLIPYGLAVAYGARLTWTRDLPSENVVLNTVTSDQLSYIRSRPWLEKLVIRMGVDLIRRARPTNPPSLSHVHMLCSIVADYKGAEAGQRLRALASRLPELRHELISVGARDVLRDFHSDHASYSTPLMRLLGALTGGCTPGRADAKAQEFLRIALADDEIGDEVLARACRYETGIDRYFFAPWRRRSHSLTQDNMWYQHPSRFLTLADRLRESSSDRAKYVDAEGRSRPAYVDGALVFLPVNSTPDGRGDMPQGLPVTSILDYSKLGFSAVARDKMIGAHPVYTGTFSDYGFLFDSEDKTEMTRLLDVDMLLELCELRQIGGHMDHLIASFSDDPKDVWVIPASALTFASDIWLEQLVLPGSRAVPS